MLDGEFGLVEGVVEFVDLRERVFPGLCGSLVVVVVVVDRVVQTGTVFDLRAVPEPETYDGVDHTEGEGEGEFVTGCDEGEVRGGEGEDGVGAVGGDGEALDEGGGEALGFEGLC